jgi:precorrin-2 dehydrogenase/sirohydrochlorin ferrochelatase
MNTLFPIFLKADQLRFIILGGGPVAFEKYRAIRQQSPAARIKVVALQFHEAFLQTLQTDENADWEQNLVYPHHIEGMDLVISAVSDKRCTSHFRELAKQQNILFNAADQPAFCDFYLGAIVRKGDLKFAISTNGKSPTMAKRWRELLDEIVPDDSQNTLVNLEKIRQQLVVDFNEKIKILNELTANFVPPNQNHTNNSNLNSF